MSGHGLQQQAPTPGWAGCESFPAPLLTPSWRAGCFPQPVWPQHPAGLSAALDRQTGGQDWAPSVGAKPEQLCSSLSRSPGSSPKPFVSTPSSPLPFSGSSDDLSTASFIEGEREWLTRWNNRAKLTIDSGTLGRQWTRSLSEARITELLFLKEGNLCCLEEDGILLWPVLLFPCIALTIEEGIPFVTLCPLIFFHGSLCSRATFFIIPAMGISYFAANLL